MTDFRIAAALINRFHQRIRDREDAGQILEIINENIRRTDFLSLNVNIDNVSFPRLEYNELILIACGTYQLKQARSYYGEHIRGDDSCTIELCRNTASSLLEGFPLPSVNCSLLRGKIHIRHISRKTYFINNKTEKHLFGNRDNVSTHIITFKTTCRLCKLKQ
ncbi:hypothetical protein SFRURICE_008889 [Spodoptera frugiperda]|nr:hypothetical protein SFRURICE_008889 [Spodoptera frugiperda]